MKTKSIAILSALVLGAFASMPAVAQDHTRGWDNTGTITQVTEVHVKDGMFNAYINDLNNVWRKFMEKQMEEGDVVGYGMYGNPNSREGEPDLYLTVTFKNWATFDRSNEWFEAMAADIMGSMEDMREANIDRSELRDIGSTYVLQEIEFTDKD